MVCLPPEELYDILLIDVSALAWSTWENATSKLLVDEEYIKRGDDAKWYLSCPPPSRPR